MHLKNYKIGIVIFGSAHHHFLGKAGKHKISKDVFTKVFLLNYFPDFEKCDSKLNIITELPRCILLGAECILLTSGVIGC